MFDALPMSKKKKKCLMFWLLIWLKIFLGGVVFGEDHGERENPDEAYRKRHEQASDLF